MNKSILSTAILALIFAPFLRADIDMQFVTVGNPGNAADTTTDYGSVPYIYQMGKYDVTLSQYTVFLNAVAAADPNFLYNPGIAENLNISGIARTGSPGSYTYSVVGNGNRPVTYVNIWDAMRMANWMQNGQPTGLGEVAGSTETGAYTMSLGAFPPRNTGATVFVPSENEWYKAAYYDPTIAGTNKYWLYATQSNTTPGNVVGAGANQANYKTAGIYSVTQSASYSSTQNYLTDVGVFSGSASYYETYDQAGNVFNWNEAIISGVYNGMRGGSWNEVPFYMQSSSRNYASPAFETGIVGFRLATSVPEPSSALLLLGSGMVLIVRGRRGASV